MTDSEDKARALAHYSEMAEQAGLLIQMSLLIGELLEARDFVGDLLASDMGDSQIVARLRQRAWRSPQPMPGPEVSDSDFIAFLNARKELGNEH